MFELLYIHNWIPPLLQKGQKLLKFSYLEGGKFFARKAGGWCRSGEVGSFFIVSAVQITSNSENTI